MLNANTKKFKNKVLNYLTECTAGKFESYGNTITFTRQDLPGFLWHAFNLEYNHEWNKKQYPNLQHRVKEWLAGLAINIEYCNANIIELLAKWYETDSEGIKQKVKNACCHGSVWEFYLNILSAHIIREWQAAGIEVYK